MTHYDISYKDMNEDEKRKKAVNDIVDYVGADKFIQLNQALMEWCLFKQPSLEAFQMTLFMFPVSGYPIQAWYETIMLDAKDGVPCGN